MRNKRNCYIAIALATLALALMAWRCWPPGRLRLLQSAAVVETRSCWQLQSNGQTLLTLRQDTTYTAACFINKWWLLPSCHGRLATHAGGSEARIAGAKAAHMLKSEIAKNDSILRGLNAQKAELTYYLRRHNVKDEGYDMLARYAQRIRRDADSLSRTLKTLRTASPAATTITRTNSYRAIYRDLHGKQKTADCDLYRTQPGGYKLLQLRSRRTPLGVIPVSLLPWVTHIPDYIFTTAYGNIGRQAISNPQIATRFGVSTPAEAKEKLGMGVQTDGQKRYAGGLKDGLRQGYGVLTEGDLLLYAGQWEAGKRKGHGQTIDKQGRTINGRWAADTLYAGSRRDTSGIYNGHMDRHGVAQGHGTQLTAAGEFYEGKWLNDRRTGFGFALAPHKYLQAGEWRDDIYRGERLVYTSERIYGIDISKYQHEIGKKKYTIDWPNLRITHLGTLSKKTISGRVDYPVSFLYIKSTEGTTVLNKYYQADYRAARKHGLHVGTYHFFSTTTPADAQAAHFIKHSLFSKGDLPPVLDLEPYPSQIAKMGGPEAMWTRVRTWLNIVERRTGVRPILYISQIFVNKYLPLAPDIKQNYHVWIARYGEYKPDIKLSYWQLSPDGRVRGIHGEVDINVFNGYQDVFNEFLRTSLIP